MYKPSKELCKCGKQKSIGAKICWNCLKTKHIRCCIICGIEFEYVKSTNKKTCSKKCAYLLRVDARGGTRAGVICEVNNCLRKVRTRKYGKLCLMHYKRYNRHGSTEEKIRTSQEKVKCKYCERTVGKNGGGARGMCQRHYSNWYRQGDPLHTDKIRKQLSTNGYRKRINGKEIHRIIMEEHIGQLIKKGEVIHHINMNKADNKIENLYLCKTRSGHSILHRKLEKLAGELVKKKIIIFKDGDYYVDTISYGIK